LRYTGADTRGACELHTLNLWQSYADPDGHSHGYSHSDSNANGYSDSYTYTDSYAYCYSNSYAYTDSYANGYSNGYAYADSYANGHRNSYAYTDTYAYGPAETKPDTKARCDTAASPVSGSGKLIVHSAAGVERPRLRAFVRQASSHPGTKFAW
jgi:hypothetical protein